MRSSSSLVVSLLVLLLLFAAGAPSLGVAAVPVHQRQGTADDGHGGSAAANSDAFYQKVGTFAVWVYSLWNDIKPVPKLESVLSASTRPAEGSAMEYLLVLRVAGLGTFRALVWGVPAEGSEDWKLKYFEPVDGA
jgi:hypothetical protein